MSSDSISVWFVCKCGSAYQSMTHFIEHKKHRHFSEFINVKCIWFEEGGRNLNNNVIFQPPQVESQVSTSNLVINEHVPAQIPVLMKEPPPDGFGFESSLGIENRKRLPPKPSYLPAIATTTASTYDTCDDLICHTDSQQDVQMSLDIKTEWAEAESNDKDDSFLRVSNSIFSPPSNNNSDSEFESEADLLQLHQLSTDLNFQTDNNVISQTPAQNPAAATIVQSLENSLIRSRSSQTKTNDVAALNENITRNRSEQVSSLGRLTNEIVDLKYEVIPTNVEIEGDSASLNLISQSEPKCELVIFATDNENENDNSTTVTHPSSLNPFAFPTQIQKVSGMNLALAVSRPRPSLVSTSTSKIDENRFWLNANKPFPPEFKCPLCRTQFNRETDLKLHMKMCSFYNQGKESSHRLKGRTSGSSSSARVSISTNAGQSSQLPDGSFPLESTYRPTFETQQRYLTQNNQVANIIAKAAKSSKCQEPYCEAIFPNLISLQQHQQHCHSISNSNPVHLQQRFSASSFTQQQQQQQQLAAGSSSKAFPTTMQNQNQHQHQHLQHQRRHMYPHIPRELLQCPENNCGKVFMSNQSLKNHVREQHGEGREKKFECSMCKKRFSFRALLNDHLLVHSNYRPLQCPVDGCPKTFKRKREVIKHERICVYSQQVNKNIPI